MGFLRFAREHLALSVGAVLGALLAVYGIVSVPLDLYRAGVEGWAWAALGLIIFFASVIILLYRFSQRLPNKGGEHDKPLVEVRDQKFRNETVVLDGRRYTGCEFTSVTFEYGGGPVDFTHNTVKEGAMLRPTTAELERYSALLFHFGYLKNPLIGADGEEVTTTSKFSESD